ncbi:hypothetical protein FIBSPDRAFT_171560 [Athelia psychrophila]|uniref:Uncharacterized protein n=1 Tax=Athelia psychrophila TaxID=1759441 RepID=A0A166AU17_9AGAM|nr:hypothetical protein FIBSPDRAFT_171560 [Fibularhizoctonia sp. CBS 109695]
MYWRMPRRLYRRSQEGLGRDCLLLLKKLKLRNWVASFSTRFNASDALVRSTLHLLSPPISSNYPSLSSVINVCASYTYWQINVWPNHWKHIPQTFWLLDAFWSAIAVSITWECTFAAKVGIGPRGKHVWSRRCRFEGLELELAGVGRATSFQEKHLCFLGEQRQ